MALRKLELLKFEQKLTIGFDKELISKKLSTDTKGAHCTAQWNWRTTTGFNKFVMSIRCQ